MMKIQINGTSVEARPGEFLLAVAARHGIDIPALCHHEAVEPTGNCRMCLVEITKPSWDGWAKLVTACLYPSEPDLIVTTHSPRVMEARAVLVDLLLARCPDSRYVQELAAEYGVTQTSYEPAPTPTEQCILCGLCVRVCEKLGPTAIATIQRGGRKKVGGPYDGPPPDCIGCASCAEVCPTKCITVVEAAGRRRIWERDFELLRCQACGRGLVTVDEARYFAAKAGLGECYYDLCDACKVRRTAQQNLKISGLPTERRTASPTTDRAAASLPTER